MTYQSCASRKLFRHTVSRYFDQGEVLHSTPDRPTRPIGDDGELNTDFIRAFINKNRALLEDPRNNVGTWIEGDTLWLDISTVIPDRKKAIKLGKYYDQYAVFYLLGKGEKIKTGGQGRVLPGWPPVEQRLPPLAPRWREKMLGVDDEN